MLSKARRILSIELRMGQYLLKWAFQRIHHQDNEYTYHKKSAAMALTFILIFVIPPSILLLGFILPWQWLTWVLGVAGIYALYWVVGLYASMVALPHRFDTTALVIHYGVLACGEIPYTIIESLALSQEGLNQSGDGLTFDVNEPIAYFKVGSITTIKIELKEPVTLQLWGKSTQAVSTIFINADRPDQLVERFNAI